jgi:hypothetical protein
VLSFYPSRALLLAVVCIATWQAQAQVPPFTSVDIAGGSRPNSGNAIAVDPSGGFYVAGSVGSIFQGGAIDLGTTNLTSRGSTDGFLAKFNVLGQCVWARQMSGILENDAYDVIVRSDGTVLVMGEFIGTNTIGNTTLVSHGDHDYDIFLAAFTAAGELLWARELGSAMDDFAIALAPAADGAALFTGSFTGDIELDGASFSSLDEDALLLKLAPNGGITWATVAGGEGFQLGSDLKVDPQGNIYWFGEFETNIVFGTTTLTSSNFNVFMAKYDSAGNPLWARKLGEGEEAQLPRVALRADGGVLCSAVYSGEYAISSQVLPAGIGDVLIASFSPAGALEWVRTFGGTELDACTELLVDTSGDCYLIGHFRGTMQVGNTKLSSTGNTDIFLARYSRMGQLQGVDKAGGFAPDIALSAALGIAGEIRFTGSFSATATFGGISVSSSDALAKMFVATVSQPPTLRITSFPTHVLLSWPAHFSAFRVQTRSELSASSWSPVSTAPILLNGELVVTNSASEPARFFRLSN